MECEKEHGNAHSLPQFLENSYGKRCSHTSDIFLKTSNMVVFCITLTMLGREAGFSAELQTHKPVIKGAVIIKIGLVMRIALKCSAFLSPMLSLFSSLGIDQKRQLGQDFPPYEFSYF